MDVVIISEFSGDFSKSDNGRFLYLAKMLAYGNQVEIITSVFLHTTKSRRNKSTEEWPFQITFIEEPGYSKNVCLKRFLSHFVWGRNVLEYIKNRKNPDVIYCAIPSLTGPSLVAKYCEKNKVRFVIDVQDLWPEAFQMVVNIPIISGILFIPFKLLANGIYKRADAICAVSDTYCQRTLKANKKCKEAKTVYLGTELSTFDRYAKNKPILEKREGEVWLSYCGTLGSSYDLISVMDALVKLDDQRIRFIVMGDGPYLERFKTYAENKNIKATFTGRLKYDSMCSLLYACDITVNPITHMAAQSIINKHADYVASGLPIVSTQENEEFRKLVEDYRMGFNCRNNDATDLAEKIKLLIDDEELRKEMGKNARRCAEEKFDRKKTYHILEKQILTKEIDKIVIG